MKRFFTLFALLAIFAVVGCNENGGDDINPNDKIEQPDDGNGDMAKLPPANQIWYTSTDGKKVFPYKTESICFGAIIISNTYENGRGVMTFDDTITSIGDVAFESCSTLASITIPNSVTSIGYQAFYECSSLVSINIPESVASIGYGAFGDCSSLIEFSGRFASEDGKCLIVDGVLNSFAPAGLTEYTIPDSVTTIGYGAFYSCSSLTSITIPDSIISIGEWAFQYCTSLTNITIPSSVTSIGDAAFYACSSLASITIPESVTEIGDRTFCGCSSLASITIPESVTEIGYYAFRNCLSLESVTIPNSITLIDHYAFRGCSSLASINIPESVIAIGEWAFCDCASLAEVYCRPTTPPKGNLYMFHANALGRKIYVPTESVEAYKTASYWSIYTEDIVGRDFE